MGMLYEYEGFPELLEFNAKNKKRDKKMILDLQYRVINGEKILCKYAPTTIEPSYEIDKEGYVHFDINKFSWQPVEMIDHE